MNERGTAILHAVGDIAFGDHPLCAGFGTHSRLRRRSPSFAFEHVSQVLATADLRFGNLECTLSERGLRPSDYHSVQMRGHAAYIGGLVQARFDVVNVANNHSQQHGPEPFEDTLTMLREAGIGVCGVRGAAGRSDAVTRTVQGIRITFLGYSLRPRQYFTEEPLYSEGTEDSIVTDVRAARGNCDILVVSLHWGDEFINRPSPDDVRLAHAVVDAGADLIVGHHPHVLRGVERRGRGWVIYSLGNFVCDMLWEEPLRETAIAECRLSKGGVEDVRLLPARINDDSQPVLLAGDAATQLDGRIRALGEALRRGESDVHQYQRDADRAHAASRTRSHRYFLRNAYRFPPKILLAQLATFTRNRLAERGWVPNPAKVKP